MISFISSIEIIIAVIPDPNIFFWIAASLANADAVNPNGIKALLPSGLSTFFIKCKLVFSNGLKRLPENPIDCHFLYNWVFLINLH